MIRVMMSPYLYVKVVLPIVGRMTSLESMDVDYLTLEFSGNEFTYNAFRGDIHDMGSMTCALTVTANVNSLEMESHHDALFQFRRKRDIALCDEGAIIISRLLEKMMDPEQVLDNDKLKQALILHGVEWSSELPKVIRSYITDGVIFTQNSSKDRASLEDFISMILPSFEWRATE